MEVVDQVDRLLKWRVVGAVASSVALQMLIFAVYNSLVLVNFWHPLTWFSYFFWTLLSPSTWVSFVLLFLAGLLVGLATLAHWSASIAIPSSRLDVLKSVASWRSLARFLAYVAVAMCIPVPYIGRGLYQPCQERAELTCLNTHNVFLITCALWTGLIFAGKTVFLSRKVMKFPIIRQDANSRLLHIFCSILKESLPKTLPAVLYLIPVYALARSFVEGLFSAKQADDQASLYSIALLLQAWALSSLVFASLRLLRHSLEIHVTKHLRLPVSSVVRLLDQPRSPLVLDLALQDLALLAAGRAGHVSPVFVLSNPGGIPHNWNKVLNHCCRVLQEFMDDLGPSNNNVGVKPAGDVATLGGVGKDVGRSWSLTDTMRGGRQEPARAAYPPYPAMRPDSPPHRYPAFAPSPVSSSDLRYTPATPQGLRRLAPLTSPLKPAPPSAPVVTASRFSPAALIGNAPAVQYLCAPVPDLRIAKLFEHCQKVVWAVGSLADLAARALHEDRFGVVVNDLPLIIATLMRMSCAISRVKRKAKNSDRGTRMRAALRSVVSRALLKIAGTYAEHLEHLPLQPDTLKQMRMYADSLAQPVPI